MNGREHLSAYLTKTQTSHAAFARVVGCTPAYISLLLSGKRPAPGGWLAQDIERATGGAVKAKAWKSARKVHAKRIAKAAQ